MHFGNSAKETNKWMTISSIRSVDRFEISNIFQDSVNSNTKLLVSQSFQVWWFSCYESIPFWNLLRCQYLEGSVETVQLESVKTSNLIKQFCLPWFLSFSCPGCFLWYLDKAPLLVSSIRWKATALNPCSIKARKVLGNPSPTPKRLQSVFSWGDISQYLLRLGEEQIHSLITQASVRRDTRKRRSLQGWTCELCLPLVQIAQSFAVGRMLDSDSRGKGSSRLAPIGVFMLWTYVCGLQGFGLINATEEDGWRGCQARCLFVLSILVNRIEKMPRISQL